LAVTGGSAILKLFRGRRGAKISPSPQKLLMNCLENLKEVKSFDLSLSSFKPSLGASQLLSPSVDLFWQSDGPQPHSILFTFHKRTLVTLLRLYIDVKQDESYSPKIIEIRAGSNQLIPVLKKELVDPLGWTDFYLTQDDPLGIRVFNLSLVILLNHQNGKDTHIRGVKLYQAQEALEE
jgi:anaphase-promoting complex subunit 10